MGLYLLAGDSKVGERLLGGRPLFLVCCLEPAKTSSNESSSERAVAFSGEVFGCDGNDLLGGGAGLLVDRIWPGWDPLASGRWRLHLAPVGAS